jgi:Uma2 family endonuclease
MALEKQLTTADQFEAFLALPENADRRFELIDGEIVEMSPTQEHGLLIAALAHALYSYLTHHPIGRVSVETRHRPPGDLMNDRIPDLSVVLGFDQPIVRQGAAPFMPDLAVEIRSPDDPYKQMRDKARFYLENGSRMVWLVFPDKKLVEVYTADDQMILVEGDTLTGGDVLPGFELAVSSIFANVQ